MLAGTSIATPVAAASFDGQWNVQIASTKAACPNGASVSIGITNGKVASSNAVMSPSGHVADAGRYPTFSEYSASVTCSIQLE